MKADIPDKILINRDEDGELHHSYWTTDQELLPFENTIYIRKDALMEWAKEKLQERHAPQFRDAIGQLIDKLNSI